MIKKLFLMVIFILTFSLVGCGTTTTTTSSAEEYSYNDFFSQFITDKTQQLSMSSGTYYIYLYGPTCSHCIEIKQQVLSLIDQVQDYDIYFVTVSVLDDVNDSIIDYGRTYIDSEHPISTPSLVKIDNHEVVHIYIGNEVIPILDNLIN